MLKYESQILDAIKHAFRDNKDISEVMTNLARGFGRQRDFYKNECEELKRENMVVLRRLAETEGIFVYFWARDCDNFERSYSHKFDSYEEYQEYLDSFYNYPEGPCYHQLMTKEEYENFEEESRDRNLEAFENGNLFGAVV